MALFTSLLFELSSMRVGMTRRARRKLHVFESRWATRHIWLMTSFAFHLSVQPRERIARLGVVELIRCFPIHHVVAALTIFSKLSFMVVVMTRNALRCLP